MMRIFPVCAAIALAASSDTPLIGAGGAGRPPPPQEIDDAINAAITASGGTGGDDREFIGAIVTRFAPGAPRMNESEVERAVQRMGSSFGNFSIGEVQDTARRIGALVTRANHSAIVVQRTANFTLHALHVDGDREQSYDTGRGTKVRVPRVPFKNQTLSVIEWVANPYARNNSRRAFSGVVSVMLADESSGNETHVEGLSDSINITLGLPAGVNPTQFTPECMYWNVSTNDWKTDGCVVQSFTAAAVVCACNHLTDFAIGSASSSGSSSSSSSTGSSSSPSSNTAIIGGVIGGVLGATLIVGLVVLVVVKGRTKRALVTAPTGPSPAATGTAASWHSANNQMHAASSV